MAAEDIGALIVRIEANLSGLEKGLDNATKTIRSKMQAAAESSQVLLAGLATLGAGIGALGIKAVSMAGDLEQSKIAFTTMLGSAEKADSFLRDLQSFAANTPFELKGLQDSSRKLLAFGFQAEQIIPMMTAIGNAVSGLGGGEAEINRVTMALGQMQAKGKVSAEEMMQLAELGIPAWDMLAKAIGTDVPTAMKKASDGAIPASQAIEGLIAGMNERFPDMMAKQSTTILGMWSTLKDNLSMGLTTLGTTIIETFDLKTKMAGMLEWLGSLTATLQEGGLRAGIEKIFPPDMQATIVMIAGAITGALVPGLIALAVSAWAAVAPLLPFMAAGAAIAGLAYLIIENWEPIKNFFPELWESIKTTVTNAANAVLDFLKNWGPLILAAVTGPIGLIVYAIVKNWDEIKETTTKIWNAVKEFVVNAFKWLYDHNYYFQQLVDAINKAWENIKSFTEKLWNSLKTWLQSIWQSISSVASSVWNGIYSALSGIMNSILSSIQNAWNSVVSVTRGAWGSVSGIISGIADEIWGTLSSLASQAWKWGANLLGEFGDGIRSRINYLRDMASNAVDSIKRILGFHSPAKEGPGKDADTWAPNLMKMYTEGIRAGIPDIKTVIDNVAGIVSGIKGNTVNNITNVTNVSVLTATETNQPLNITLTLDGAVLSRQLYYLNQGKLRGQGV